VVIFDNFDRGQKDSSSHNFICEACMHNLFVNHEVERGYKQSQTAYFVSTLAIQVHLLTFT